MGQGPSADATADFEFFKGKIQRQASYVKEIVSLDYGEFKSKLAKLNELASVFGHSDTSRLSFVVKDKTDQSVFWKKTVRVNCIRVNNQSNRIESCKIMNLHQFLQAYNMLTNFTSMQCNPFQAGSSGETSFEVVDGYSGSLRKSDAIEEDKSNAQALTSSFIMERLLSFESDAAIGDECCICMERTTEIMLPCTHCFCLVCLEQWNDANRTCPLCREELKSEDTWVISEAPGSEEIAAELQKAMEGITENRNEES